MGDRVRRLREARGLTQDDLADQAGLTRQSVYRIENKRENNPRRETKEALARALGESVLYLETGYRIVGNDSAEALPSWDVVLRATSSLRESDIEAIRRYVQFLEAEQERELRQAE